MSEVFDRGALIRKEYENGLESTKFTEAESVVLFCIKNRRPCLCFTFCNLILLMCFGNANLNCSVIFEFGEFGQFEMRIE